MASETCYIALGTPCSRHTEIHFTVCAQSGCEGLISRLGIEAHIVMGLWSEFKLKKQADMVPRDGGSQNVCNVIYQKVYLIRLIIVSWFKVASLSRPACQYVVDFLAYLEVLGFLVQVQRLPCTLGNARRRLPQA